MNLRRIDAKFVENIKRHQGVFKPTYYNTWDVENQASLYSPCLEIEKQSSKIRLLVQEKFFTSREAVARANQLYTKLLKIDDFSLMIYICSEDEQGDIFNDH